jgi:hypothetical protein
MLERPKLGYERHFLSNLFHSSEYKVYKQLFEYKILQKGIEVSENSITYYLNGPLHVIKHYLSGSELKVC